MKYLMEIVAGRQRRIAAEGPEMGEKVPAQRQHSLVPILQTVSELEPLLVCEIKRRSPSRGLIAPKIDAVQQARRYATSGVRAVSVLTERDHFAGSLSDLMEVKAACPELSVLRKDFLLDERDIEVSYRAGADAVLLIAACLSDEKLKALYERTCELGMTALIEVHDAVDLTKARTVRPQLTGINSRDLNTFNVDTTIPAQLRAAVDWPTTLLFESGIHTAEDAAFAFAAGFDGILVGEAVVRRPELVKELQKVIRWAVPIRRDKPLFWQKIFSAVHQLDGTGRPLVKICGITNRDDAELAIKLGADLLGFILASGPRHVSADTVASLSDLSVMKIGVVVDDVSEALSLLQSGFLDAVQFHGEQKPNACYKLAFPYYTALRVGSSSDFEREYEFHCPRVLLDAFSPLARGGTGRSIDDRLLDQRSSEHPSLPPLWLAGGVGPSNVASIISKYHPELVDVSSRLEITAGHKDPKKLREFFHQVYVASQVPKPHTTMIRSTVG